MVFCHVQWLQIVSCILIRMRKISRALAHYSDAETGGLSIRMQVNQFGMVFSQNRLIGNSRILLLYLPLM